MCSAPHRRDAFASAATIPLTSFRIPRREIRRIATELLEPTLVVRESTVGGPP